MSDQPQPSTENALDFLITFSVEELALLLHEMGLERLPGFVPPQSYTDLVWYAARNSLMARNLLSESPEGKLLVPEAIATLLSSGALAKRILRFIAYHEARQTDHWIYVVEGYSVYHVAPRPGLEQFQTISTGTKLAQLFALVIGLNPTGVDAAIGEPIQLSFELYNEARRLKDVDDVDRAYYLLADNGVDSALASVIAKPSGYTIISVVNTKTPTIASGMMILQSPSGYYVFTANLDLGSYEVSLCNDEGTLQVVIQHVTWNSDK